MSKLTTFMHNEHRFVSARITQMIADLEAELGVKFSVGGGEVGSAGGVIKIKVAVVTDAAGGDPLQKKFAASAHFYGLKASDYGRQFWVDGICYKVVGFNVRAPKFAIAAVRVHDDRPFKFPTATVQRHFAAQDAKKAVA